MKPLPYVLTDYTNSAFWTGRAFNYYFQSSAADVVVRNHMVTYPYHVCSADGTALAHAHDEPAAIREAESRARANPGTKFYVTKAIAVSHVAPAPSITTRL